MILTIQGDIRAQEVIGEPFTIDGSAEQFAVHRGIGWDSECWVTTHVETGFRFAEGDTIKEAIENAQKTWLSKSPEQIEEAKKRARESTEKRLVEVKE